jgi:hypothetical protein
MLELSTDFMPTTSPNESKDGELCTTATITVSIHHLELRMTQNQEGENDESMHMFAASGVYIKMFPWPPPFTMRGRQGYAVSLKLTLSRGQLKCKKGMMMMTCL